MMDNPVPRVTTGLPFIDDLMGGGVGHGEVLTVVAKSFTGKSWFLQNMLEANLDRHALFASLEMPAHQVIARSMSLWSGRRYEDVIEEFEDGSFDRQLLAEWAAAHERQLTTTAGGMSVAELDLMVHFAQERMEAPIEVVMVDYLELVKSEGEGFGEVQATAEDLKRLAKRRDVAVVVAHQANNGQPNGRRLKDGSMRYAGFEQSDHAIGMWAPHMWEPLNKREDGDALDWDERRRLAGLRGLNLIKSRSRGKTDRAGWHVRIDNSGRFDADQPMPLAYSPGERPPTMFNPHAEQVF